MTASVANIPAPQVAPSCPDWCVAEPREHTNELQAGVAYCHYRNEVHQFTGGDAFLDPVLFQPYDGGEPCGGIDVQCDSMCLSLREARAFAAKLLETIELVEQAEAQERSL